MKLRSSILAAALVLLAVSAVAQPYGVNIGARGGLTIPRISAAGKTTPLSDGYKSRMAFGAGVFADFRFTPAFSIQVGLEYSSQGGKKSGFQALPAADVLGPMMAPMGGALTQIATQLAGAGNATGAQQVAQFGAALGQFQAPKYLYADFESEAKFNYVMLPVQAKWGWNLTPTSPVRIYFGAGVFVSRLVSAEQVMSGTSALFTGKDRMTTLGNAMGMALNPALEAVTDGMAKVALTQFVDLAKTTLGAPQDFDQTKDIYDELKKFNYGLIGHAGIQYSFGANNLFLEGGGNYGLAEIQKGNDNGKNRIGSGSVMVGYSRTIGGR